MATAEALHVVGIEALGREEGARARRELAHEQIGAALLAHRVALLAQHHALGGKQGYVHLGAAYVGRKHRLDGYTPMSRRKSANAGQKAAGCLRNGQASPCSTKAR